MDSDRIAELRRHLAEQPELRIDAGSRPLVLTSRHGLFSARSLDEGSALLLRELQRLSAPSRVLDLGCGYGAIGLTLAARWPDAQVDMVDTDMRAVESAAENIALNQLANATVTLSDGTRQLQQPLPAYDLVVANLPAQAGNDALDQLLLDAYDAMTDGGSLALVVVNGLRRYLTRRLVDIFGPTRVAKVKQSTAHTVLEAAKLSR
ncbi:MAG: methyltransferase [Chloroflexi bacterium]|nr:methyltransferase [Chloroflexota bacterium]